MADEVAQFTNVDAAGDPTQLVALMDSATAIDGVRRSRQLAIEELKVGAASRLLDLGCGAGDAAAELASVVGPRGEVIGVDCSDAMVTTAKERFGSFQLPLRFERGDARSLRFPDGSFDACRSERMLCHVPDPRGALAEMTRVTRPGGRVVVIDIDMDLIVIDHPDMRLVRLVVQRAGDSIENGRIGRQLPRLFRDVGLRDITKQGVLVDAPLSIAELVLRSPCASLEAEGLVTREESERFWAEIGGAAAAQSFFCVLGILIVAGTKAS